ncbi:hypothetical protein [Streptomyces malaysiensis]|uniref:Uncharacterized protein n=1 Tax=Streptomyces malaysiensis subsp. samsunensis TaxID=459658 RepID=A0A9X2LYB3_STRMQ|nr:hypothetical protein [Streptomyces samsunensis]MCQ8831789.1 hypothetical protein [Streptomyces samsunensis]
MTTNHTPTDDRDAAIHWAAVAIGLKESREQRGKPLTAAEQAAFERYQDAARQHGITDAQIREYLRNLPAR